MSEGRAYQHELGARSSLPISVVIPCFQCSSTIEAVVASVARQVSPPLEVILVDDASSDGTLELLDRLVDTYPDGWLRVVSRDTNAGPAACRNQGWNLARFPHVAFLDSDDIWFDTKLAVQHAFMLTHPSVQVCGHASGVGNRQPADCRQRGVRNYVSYVTTKQMLRSNRLSTSTVMLKRDLTERFDERRRRSEDYGLWVEMSLNGRTIAVLSVTLCYYGKPKFGAGGLSLSLWQMEWAQLDVYRGLWRRNRISRAAVLLLYSWSLARFGRRAAIVGSRRIYHILRRCKWAGQWRVNP